MAKVLLHICCAPCSTVPIKRLKDQGFNITCFFYNPNIFPEEEEKKRREEVIKYLDKEKIPYFIDKGSHKDWLEIVKGLEKEPEGGARCFKCYEIRIRKTAEIAKDKGYDAISVTLTVSPHKNAKIINEIGEKTAGEFNLKFICEDFKKKNGFKESLEISQKEGFYRQNYCGCEFSQR